MDDGLQSRRFGKNVTRSFAELNASIRRNRRNVVMAIQAALQGQIVEELSHPGTGRLRRVRRADRASAPGEPPAPDKGALRGSIQIEYDDLIQKGRTGTNKVYAAPLNFGTQRAGPDRKTVIAPRPFMEPALKKALGAMTKAGLRVSQLALRSRGR